MDNKKKKRVIFSGSTIMPKEKLSLRQQSVLPENLQSQYNQQNWQNLPANSVQYLQNKIPQNLQENSSSPGVSPLIVRFHGQHSKIIPGSPVIDNESVTLHQPLTSSTNISQLQNTQNQHIFQQRDSTKSTNSSQTNPSPMHIKQQHSSPSGQVVNIEETVPSGMPNHHHSHAFMGGNHHNFIGASTPNGVVVQSQNMVQGHNLVQAHSLAQSHNLSETHNIAQSHNIAQGHNHVQGHHFVQGQNLGQGQHVIHPQQRILVNRQSPEPSGPGRPNIQMLPVSMASNKYEDHPHHLHYQHLHNYQPFQNVGHHFDPCKGVRGHLIQTGNGQFINGFRPNAPHSSHVAANTTFFNHQKVWHKISNTAQTSAQKSPNQVSTPIQSPQTPQSTTSVYERVPPLHQHTPPPNTWTEEVTKKKVKLKTVKKRPYILDNQRKIVESHAACPNIDVRQISPENGRPVLINQHPQQDTCASPSFMEDPSGYLAQQTALLNSTISRQTGANVCSLSCNSPSPSIQSSQLSQSQILISESNSQNNGVPLPSNIMSQMKQNLNIRANQNMQNIAAIKNQTVPLTVVPQQHHQMMMTQGIPDSSAMNDQYQNYMSSDRPQYQNSLDRSNQYVQKEQRMYQADSRSNSQPGTPSPSGTSEDPVTSTFHEKNSQNSPDSRPIQGGTVSTSNVSSVEGSPGPSTPKSHTPTPPIRNQDSNISQQSLNQHKPNQGQNVNQQNNQNVNQQNIIQNFNKQNVNQQNLRETPSSTYQARVEGYYTHPHTVGINNQRFVTSLSAGTITTMASGGTVGSNTITSVLAGRANTATVSINAPTGIPVTIMPTVSNNSVVTSVAATQQPTKSPLEMVQSVVSSIQISHQNAVNQQMTSQPPHMIKHQSQNLPPGHILVSSGGQIIMASTGNLQSSVMPPPPPKLLSQNSMPPISVSPMITNVTAAVSQVIPAVAQQVLGQQTVLVNALPAPLLLQSGVAMTVDGMAVGQNMQIPQLVAGNVIQQQIQIDGSDSRRVPTLLSPETRKKGKKRKLPQAVASIHIAAQQNPGVVMAQQGFPQQIQMHSPQGITAGPVMQALTIVPGKAGAPPQIVMNGQTVANAGHLGAQQLIAGSQPTQQINLLQPVNLLNGTTGMVQNFSTIQQFILPNLGGMVMNADGTATLLPDTSNIGMQLQLQNVNGQNVLTPIQNNNMFNSGQGILAAGPAGMVIRAPGAHQGKIIQQQHSPGAQFLSPNGGQFVVNGAQFSGQLSPLVANVSPTQQVSFGTGPQIRQNTQQGQQEFIHCNQIGQTLMVPCNPSGNITSSTANPQNTTFVQQNTTIVQQQTTMVANNQQLQNFQGNQSNQTITRALNVDQNFIVNPNEKQPVQALLVQRQSPQASSSYRHSVSTQTAVNKNAQSVTTNTYCQTSTTNTASSPPDTTTLSPLAAGNQTPPTVDTTTHTGSTDDGLSPAPSNSSGSCGDIVSLQRHNSSSMAMVHCVSSSEPDSADLQSTEQDWSRNQNAKMEFNDISSVNQIHMARKSSGPIHLAYAESSTNQYLNDQSQEAVVCSRNFQKLARKGKHAEHMESRRINAILFEDDEEAVKKCQDEVPKLKHNFVTGDLVWGPAKGHSSWPGKIIGLSDEKVIVQWFGTEKIKSVIDPRTLQTLSEGLDAHHQARKKSRTSRKLNTNLENAIQEAMTELDIKPEIKSNMSKLLTSNNSQAKTSPHVPNRKGTGRLRSSQR